MCLILAEEDFMKLSLMVVGIVAMFCAVALSGVARADEEVPTEQEIKQSEGAPPTIPHKVRADVTDKECLGCHRTGKKGAPVTPHPQRLACTQCHVPGAVEETKEGRKKK
jgi:cytochrome c-type protein NapB